MGLSATTTIFLFVVCLCGGIIIGALFSRMRAEPAGKTDANGAEERQEEKKELLPPQTNPSLSRPGDAEVMRVWRDKTGGVWLEMDGQRLESREALQVEQKNRLRKLVLDLRPWLEVPPSAPPKAVTPEIQPQIPPAAEPPRRASIFAPRPARSAAVPAEIVQPAVNLKSIVEQIDDVLQQKLAGSAFASLGIHLLEGSRGEVMVQIGSMRHPGVDAIPNPEIQALIRQAIAEWEKQAG